MAKQPGFWSFRYYVRQRRPQHGKNSADSKWLLLQSGLPQDLQHRHRGDRYPHHAPDPSDVPLLADQRGPGHFKAPGPGVRAEAGHHRVHPALADFRCDPGGFPPAVLSPCLLFRQYQRHHQIHLQHRQPALKPDRGDDGLPGGAVRQRGIYGNPHRFRAASGRDGGGVREARGGERPSPLPLREKQAGGADCPLSQGR